MILRPAACALLLAFFLAAPSLAQEPPKPEDTVSYDIAAEDWVTTKNAHVTLSVEASVSSANAGAMRNEMTKAVNDAAKADWRLTGFNRSQDQTGLERWSVVFEARIAESSLNGLPDAIKKASKPGMQIKVMDVDFAPTLEENETGRAALRTRLLKSIGEQLTALNGSLPGRGYRIAEITFDPQGFAPRPMMRNKGMMMDTMTMGAAAMPALAPENAQLQDHSQKLVMRARVVFAAVPAAPAH